MIKFIGVLLCCCLLSGCSVNNTGKQETGVYVRQDDNSNVEGTNQSDSLDEEANQSDSLDEETVGMTENIGFELKLYKELSKEGKNLVVSPYSLADAVSLLYNAADGETKRQMEKILGLSDDKFNFYRSYDSESKDGLTVANRAFYTDDNVELNLDVLGTSDIQKVNMGKEAVDIINQYVSDNTNNKIQNLLEDGQLDDALLVLVNALYFNQKFNFESKNIKWSDDKYYSAFGDDISLLNIKEATDSIDVLKLDYLDDENKQTTGYSLYIICDSEDSTERGADEYVKGLAEEELSELLDFSNYHGLEGYDEANFIVPDYEIEYKESLTEVLKNMGFTEAFNSYTTDFDRLGPVYIDDIMQAAYIKTDKNGTEAAAATSITMLRSMAMEEMSKRVKNVRADDEFVYVLKDNINDVILFMGKVTETSAFNTAND